MRVKCVACHVTDLLSIKGHIRSYQVLCILSEESALSELE